VSAVTDIDIITPLSYPLKWSGSFTYAQEDLYNKSLKSYFKFSKEFLLLKPNIHISMHVFDHTIKPILLYGCEIWGSFNPFTSKFRKDLDLVDEPDKQK
jgi:hypothetical protein